MDPQTCRSQLGRLVNEENALLRQLAQQLQREHDLLAANDVDGLEKAGSARQATITQLLKIDDQRRQLCRLTGRGFDKAGLSALVAWCDPAGTLSAAQNECTQLAAGCRAQNERNGALVAARLSRVSSMLDMLAENAPARTYDSRLARAAAPIAGRMFSASA
jgi:flagellar biosynthesis/type III secretory pathway chaperone